MVILNLSLEKQMDVQIIQKILQQQKQVSIFLVDIQSQQFGPFDHRGNKHTLYRRKDCIKKFCTSLREHAKNIIDFLKKEMLPLRTQKLKTHQDSKVWYICGKRILERLSKHINYWKVRDHCQYTGNYRSAAYGICNSKFYLPNEMSVNFHNGSN